MVMNGKSALIPQLNAQVRRLNGGKTFKIIVNLITQLSG